VELQTLDATIQLDASKNHVLARLLVSAATVCARCATTGQIGGWDGEICGGV